MKELKFIEGPWPKGFKADFESFLFNEGEHLRLQSRRVLCFSLLREDGKKVVASINFSAEGPIAMSPLKAPFGSFRFSDMLAPRDLYEFILKTEDALRKLEFTSVFIKNPPAAYSQQAYSLLEVLLINCRYTVTHAEAGAVIHVDKSVYEKRIEKWEARKLKQAKRAGLRFKQIPLSMIEGVYGLIAMCRQERGQALSMNFEEVVEVANTFPERVLLFGVFNEGELVAASISIRVGGAILYNFYSAHLSAYDKVSPVVLLISGMYSWCKGESISLLDLGTSATEGQPNFGLLDFKKRLSGVVSAKLSFRKELR